MERFHCTCKSLQPDIRIARKIPLYDSVYIYYRYGTLTIILSVRELCV